MYLIERGPEVPLDADAIIRKAKFNTNLDDLGDAAFEQGLNALIGSFRSDVWHRFEDEVKRSIGRSLVDLLEGRLKVIQDRKTYPAIQAEVIEAPIFFIGMPRTGSTLLHSLVAQDPANIAPELWETMRPSPPPRFGLGSGREAAVAEIMSWYIARMPEILAFHPYYIEDGYSGLAECGSIGEFSFAAYVTFGVFGVTDYFRWFAQADHLAAIEFHKMFLQHLQWGRPGRTWVCKSVDHGIFLDALLKVYPDAVFVWTHRDPLTQAASMASTRSGVRQALFKESFSDPKSLYEFGESALLAMKLTADRGIAARKNASDRTFIDVYYPDLVSDPVGTVRKIYDRIGRPLTAETELRISSWLRRNAADKGGGHHYTVEEFGLTDEMIKSEMEGYLNVFGDGLAESSARNAR